MFRTEDDFVKWLRRHVAAHRPRLLLGIGDDAALVSVAHGQEMILTSDLSIEDVHFRRELHPPRSVGHRALARSLSDIAAMGGRPRFALVSLAISTRISSSWLKAFYLGMTSLAKRFGVAIIGGDTAVSPDRVSVDVVAVGEVPRGQALRRVGARPGDQIFVSGCLGSSAWGLRLLKQSRGGLRGVEAACLRSHLYPEPRCALGRFLVRKGLASSAIDISDGLSTDLMRLCGASGVGSRLWTDLLPVPKSPRIEQRELLRLALHGGEDYELLFTVPRNLASKVPARFQGIPLHRVGEVISTRAAILVLPDGRETALRPAGYDHFRKASH